MQFWNHLITVWCHFGVSWSHSGFRWWANLKAKEKEEAEELTRAGRAAQSSLDQQENDFLLQALELEAFAQRMQDEEADTEESGDEQ